MGKLIKGFFISIPLAVLTVLLTGCDSCGFDCSDENASDDPALLNLRFSDSRPEDLNKVVLQVNSITLTRSPEDDELIETFTIDALDAAADEAFKIDLLKYRGKNQQLVVEEHSMDADSYDSLVIEISSGDDTLSYVEEADGIPRAIFVDNGALTLDGLNLQSGTQNYTVEFGLALALQYQEETDTYLLTTEGVRLLATDSASHVTGTVANALFDTETECADKEDSLAGNRVYLYEGHDLLSENLIDVTSSSDTSAPIDSIAPVAVAYLYQDPGSLDWEYVLSYLPPGDTDGAYTIAFACNTGEDDAVTYDALTIPQPADQLYEVTLTQSESTECNITEDPDTGC